MIASTRDALELRITQAFASVGLVGSFNVATDAFFMAVTEGPGWCRSSSSSSENSP